MSAVVVVVSGVVRFPRKKHQVSCRKRGELIVTVARFIRGRSATRARATRRHSEQNHSDPPWRSATARPVGSAARRRRTGSTAEVGTTNDLDESGALRKGVSGGVWGKRCAARHGWDEMILVFLVGQVKLVHWRWETRSVKHLILGGRTRPDLEIYNENWSM